MLLCSKANKLLLQVFITALREDSMGLDYNKIHFKYKNKLENNTNLWLDDNTIEEWKDDDLNMRVDDQEYLLELKNLINLTEN